MQRNAFPLILSLLPVLHFATPGAHAQALGCTPSSLSLAQQQLTKTMAYIGTSQFPLATVLNSSTRYSSWSPLSATDWTSGFFPGWIWSMYEQTLDSSLLSRAKAQTASLLGEATDASGHDIGFRIMNSYGNGYRISRDPSYMSVIQTAAQTMATLYQPGPGVINSWPYYSTTKTTVIIDNMMTIELLFYAAQNGGNPNWYNMAVSHALKTMQNNVRADGSTFQGVEYNSDGSVYSKFTADGYSTNSTWSRGQAWGLSGFTMAYRYTQDPRFLATAQQLANYFIGNLPPDYVPYWDFSQSNYRDSSGAAIAAYGLLELSTYVPDPYKTTYYNTAINIQTSLTSSYYLGNPLNTDGILLHGTYSVPYNANIDTSLIWGDYYFIRGCYRTMSPPPAPANLAATAAAPNQANLSWDAPSGAIRYSVKRSGSPGGPYTTIAPPPILTANSFSDTTVAASTPYYYVVSAINVAGEGPNSAEVAVSTPAGTATATSLSSSLNPSTAGQSVTFTATVSPSTAAGTVQFTVDGSVAGSPVALSAGVASFATSTLSAGTHSIIAAYSGNSTNTSSTSNTVTQTVVAPPAPDFNISVSPATQTVTHPGSATYIVTVSPTNGFVGGVNLSISGLPPRASDSFSPNPISGGSGNSTLTISTSRKTPSGTRTLTITGTSGGLKHTANVSLTVN